MTVHFQGPIGPFADNVQQRQVPVDVVGTCEFSSGPGANPAAEQQVQQQMLRAVREVVGAKMATEELEFRHLGLGEMGHVVPEILAASGLSQMGIQVYDVGLSYAVDGHTPWGTSRWVNGQVSSQIPGQDQAKPAGGSSAPAVKVPEIRANIRVGGFNVHASSSGGIDAGGLANQALSKAKNQLMWYVWSGVFVLVALLLIGGIGLYAWYKVSAAMPGGTAAAVTPKWDGKGPLTCTGSDVMTVTGVTANLQGTAITASGSCSLTLINVDVTAATAIDAGGSAVVTIQGGKVTGSTLAVRAMGASKVTISGAKVTGKTQALGAAKISGP